MVWSIFEHNNQFVDIERIEVDNIPCLRFRPKGLEGSMPTVLYYHGWHSSKEFQRFKGMTIASFGYQVIAPDAIYHGEREPIDYDAPGMLEKYFWEIVLQTVDESDDILNTVIDDHQADPDRIGIMGSSMGGFIASGIFVKHPELRCLVNFNGSCAYLKAVEVERKMKVSELSTSDFEKIQHLIEYDPMEYIDHLKGRPILMLHGDSDSSVPIEIQRFFYEKLSPLYEESDKIKLIEAPKMDHYISVGMLEKGVEWLKIYL